MSPSIRVAIAVLLCWTIGPAASRGQDFRVENDVFTSGGKKPDAKSITIFHAGKVYDHLDKPAEAIVFDPTAKRFHVLNLVREVQSELTTDEVVEFTKQLTEAAAANPDPMTSFYARPSFDEKFDKAHGQLTLGSPWITYKVRLSDGKQAGLAERYRDFADWYARLNTVLNCSMPPGARLLVNEAVARHRTIAEAVEVSRVTPGPKGRRITLRSEHRVAPQLAKADMDRVAEIELFLDKFKSVSFSDYRGKNTTKDHR